MTETPGRISVATVLGLHHASLPCNDLDRAVDFYERVLGMRQLGAIRNSNGRVHFLGTNVPQGMEPLDLRSGADYQEYLDMHQQANNKPPETNFVRMQAGDIEVVLFQRLRPDEGETLLDNGIYHILSLHISSDDMDRLTDMKRRGDSSIRFHTGPTLRWPNGLAMYLWDSEGNYLELESEEDLPARYGSGR